MDIRNQIQTLIKGNSNICIKDEIVVFGAGYWGKGLIYLCEFWGVRVSACFDNNADLQNQEVHNGVRCLLPQKTDKLVLLSFANEKVVAEAKEQLKELGVDNYAEINHTKLEELVNILPDVEYLDLVYYRTFNEHINWKRPISFNEKMQWLKVNNRKKEYTTMVDKYEAKGYVGNIIGNQYIIPTIGIWDSVEDIDFKKMPKKYVLKCTHDSGSTILVDDNTDLKSVCMKLKSALAVDYYSLSREWPYKDVRPRILAEQFLEDDTKCINDYKFFCFNGEVKCFKIDFDRQTEHHANYYDRNCNLMEFGEAVCPPVFSKKPEIPSQINEMITLAETLAKGIPFLRVDFYYVNNSIYFGELTFFPAAGFGKFVPEQWDEKLGNWISIPTDRNNIDYVK